MIAQARCTLFGTLALAVALSVVPAAAQDRLPDGTVEAVVAHRLAARGLDGAVTVEAVDGVVTLTGTVETLSEKMTAGKVARKTEGVDAVVNELEVASRASDEAIAEEISIALDVFFYHDVFDWVTATVDDGAVDLLGSVYVPWHREAIVDRVARVPGVTSIQDHIALQSVGGDPLRAEAFRAIYGHLAFNEWIALGRAPIHIVVEAGKVTLEGEVRSLVEKRLAESLVRTETSTFGVTNHLRVTGSRA